MSFVSDHHLGCSFLPKVRRSSPSLSQFCATSFSWSESRLSSKEAGRGRTFAGCKCIVRILLSILLVVLTDSRLILQSLRPQFNFVSLIIVEPMVSALGTPILDSLKQELITRARRRKNVWRSPEEARRSLVLKSFWDPRVLDVFIVRAFLDSSLGYILTKLYRNMPCTGSRRRMAILSIVLASKKS